MIKIVEDDLRGSLKSFIGDISSGIVKGLSKKVGKVSDVADKLGECESELEDLCNDPELRDNEDLRDVYNAIKKARSNIDSSVSGIGSALKKSANKVNSD